MRGHPSPEWLLAIGESYQLDPEFFQRHIDSSISRQDNFSSPPLPSASTLMIKLRITTLGVSPQTSKSLDEQWNLENLRLQNAKPMNDYHHKTKKLSDSKLGDSILRECSVHDFQHFSIEQDISIHVIKTWKGWVGIVWLDHGNDLSQIVVPSLIAPLQSHALNPNHIPTNYLPVTQYRPGVALKPRSRLLAPTNAIQRTQVQIPQSASLLHLDYSRGLDRRVAALDSFYALHELFSFASFSEIQFLNMLESKLKKELDQSVLVRQKNPTISNILYNRQVLERHTQRIRDNIASIRCQSRSCWPQGQLDETKQQIADSAAQTLLRDYEYLLARCLTISELCDRGTQIVMNNAMIKESREAISQAEGIAKLTRLAFFFIPLSFTTSFFGMNFLQFDTGKVSIWVWFVVSVPILSLTLLLLRYDIVSLLRAKRRASDPASSMV
ncbi:uncharacterized protein BDZ99DRAFT_435597 [Mytilinidion resinicola]|uniref:Uncharacterized protein n=1 Tax=Mytilinidion resinicola TaxID=574789 RepID=A0A6A6Z4Y8_9PEZI|nr:uncharacterized protein BDZ99DRAFT_435597 [Mytilinidion resinicola]KAF2815317.1 hypothetical protein BDZ99DRAFT_435597 [Mytilinidion resinicola]